jgi:phosphoribosylanthranilate isomerase
MSIDVRPQKALLTGVFVDATLEEILTVAKTHKLSAVQLHGGQNKAFCLSIKQSGLQVIKVFHPADEGYAAAAGFEGHADLLLFDNGPVGTGGSGQQFDWKSLEEYHGSLPFLLSGGIGPDDYEKINAINHPAFAGIDLNSRFEIQPGYKNITLLETFLKNLRR